MRRIPRSRASASSAPPDAFITALVLLGRRELSEAQLRARLRARDCDHEAIEAAIERLKRDRALDDGRVARAAARLEAGIRGRGPARVRRRLATMGLDEETVAEAVREVFADVDEGALLDQALTRRLRGQPVEALDERGRGRLIRGLVGQGFGLDAVLRRLRRA